MKTNHLYILTFFFVTVSSLMAQKKSENIGTEEINIVKPYAPTISDAFKIKEIPPTENEQETEKEKVSYSIFSFPVASTFTPSKGKAQDLAKEKAEKLFGNFLTLGFGNYGTPLLDFYTAHQLANNQYIGATVNHLSSQGGIKNIPLNNSYYNTSADFTYGAHKKTLGWNADLGYQHQIYNWYGVPHSDVFSFSKDVVEAINPKQTYQNFYAGGKFYSKIKSFRSAEIKYNRFWDASSSVENRVYLLPSFEFKAENQKIKTDFVFDYLAGNFQQQYVNPIASSYGYANIGFQPSIVYRKNEFSFNIGAGVFMMMNTGNAGPKNKLYVYPQVTAAYQIVPAILSVYAGAEGGLVQNSYQQMVQQNPFVSPTLFIAPTDKLYELYLGIKGKFSNSLSFNAKGFHIQENAKYLFVNNQFQNNSVTTLKPYEFANSFGVTYDDVQTTGAFGELKLQLDKTFSATLNTTYSSYNTKLAREAWNLPQLKGSLTLEYNIDSKWQAQVQTYYVGKRKDVKITEANPNIVHNTVNLKDFIDANLQVNYKYNNRLTGFIRGNNLANQAYQKWVNYPVQSLQVMVGASYKFDF